MLSVQCGHTSSSHHISKKTRHLPKSFGEFAPPTARSINSVATRALEHLKQLHAAKEPRTVGSLTRKRSARRAVFSRSTRMFSAPCWLSHRVSNRVCQDRHPASESNNRYRGKHASSSLPLPVHRMNGPDAIAVHLPTAPAESPNAPTPPAISLRKVDRFIGAPRCLVSSYEEGFCPRFQPRARL